MSPPLTDFVVCPLCAGPLTAREKQFLVCQKCAGRFPSVGSLACLLRDSKAWLELWQAQLAVIHEQAELAVEALEEESRKPGLLATTRARLLQQLESQRRVVRELDALLVPAIGKPVLRPTLQKAFQPLESLHLLHRDWGWPESDENARALACVEQVLCAPLGRLLVIGCGAARLAYDLHVRHGATTTVALDVDPLTLLVAEKMANGGSLQLLEARVDSARFERLSAQRTLQAPLGAAGGFHCLLADGLRAPLRDHAFDSLLTPWFIDQIPPDFREFVAEIQRLLVPGGRWLNFGPLIYPSSRSGGCRFTLEELFELTERAGFLLEKQTFEALPYSVSPLTERGKLENCVAFCARSGAVPEDESRDPPSWIVLPHLPVPDFAGRSAFQHESAALRAIVELIDGTRSINAIVAAFAAATGMNPPGMVDTVRYCLLETHPACRSARH